jgi:hypothetical protein
MYIIVNHRNQRVNNRIFTSPLAAAEELGRLQRLNRFGIYSILQVAPDGDE